MHVAVRPPPSPPTARRSPLPVALALLLLVAGCGRPPTRTRIERVLPATRASAEAVASQGARQLARQMARDLGPSAWTWHDGGGETPFPEDFRAACRVLHEAWEEAVRVFPEDRSVDDLRSESGTSRAALALDRIDAAYARVVSRAAAHGVQAPESWIE